MPTNVLQSLHSFPISTHVTHNIHTEEEEGKRGKEREREGKREREREREMH
jgi:hypothetical protein